MRQANRNSINGLNSWAKAIKSTRTRQTLFGTKASLKKPYLLLVSIHTIMKLHLTGTLFALLSTTALRALPITYSTNDINGTGLSASVTITPTFSVLNQTLTLLINGLVANPKSVIQGLAAIDFTVTGGLIGNLTSASGQLITIANSGTFANIAGTPNWLQTTPNTDFYTTTLSGGSKNVLLGAPAIGGYTNANGSIAGNSGHPAWVREQFTLVYTLTGITASTNITSLSLGFGTVPFLVTANIPPSGVPEPGTAIAMLSGVAALAGWRKLKK